MALEDIISSISGITSPLTLALSSFGSEKSQNDTSTKETPTGGLTNVKSPATKGGFNYGNVALDSSNSQEILSNMQKYLDERNSPFNKIQSHLKDAAAWGVSNMDGNFTRAMNERDKQKLEEMQDLQSVRAQMAALKSAQSTQDVIRNQVYGQLGVGGAGGTNNAGGAGGVDNASLGTALTNKGFDAQTVQYILNLNARDPAAAQAYIGKLLEQTNKAKSELEYSPKMRELVNVMDKDRGLIQVPLSKAANYDESNLPNLPISNNATAPSQPATAVPPTNQTGIQPQHIAQIESGNRPFAVGPEVSGQGSAKSAMQVMDATATDPGFGVKPAQLNGDPVHDEAERVRVGTEYFNAMKDKYKNDTLASMAQNWGPGNVDKWLANGADISKIPQETKDYIAKAHLTSATDNIVKPSQSIDNKKNITMPSASPGVGISSQSSPIKEVPYDPPSTVITPEEKHPLANETAASYSARLEALKTEKQKAREVYDAQYKKMAETNAQTVAKASEAQSTNEAAKRKEYDTDYNSADSAFSNFNNLLEASKNHHAVFNLRGQSLVNYWLGKKLQPGGAEHLQSPNAELIQLESPENQTAYHNIGVGSANATGAWAKQLVSNGGGNRLTNADLKLGSLAKGVGTDMTYDAHMNNLAHNMETAKIMELRAKGWHDFHEKNPNATTSDFEMSPNYKAARDQAKIIVGKIFKDAGVPEIYADPSKNKPGYIHADKNKRPYTILSNGDRVYL
jgi:hypothetical protein